MDRMVPIIDIEGEEVGSVTVPEGTVGALVVASDPKVVIIEEVVSRVVDITLVGSDGNVVTEFDEAIEICFETEEDKEDVCLGFFNTEGRWECEDFCLESSDDGRLCGESDHLTNFALLLSTADAGDKCESSSTDYVVLYLSIALVIVALVTVAVVAVWLELRLRSRRRSRESTFRDMERGVADLTTD